MDRSSLIALVNESQTQDENGVWRTTRTERTVFAQIESVTRAEFFEGGRNGLNPQYRFTMFCGDYNGETVVIYKGLPYSVYRTYLARTDTIELYVERKGGTNGKKDSQADQS